MDNSIYCKKILRFLGTSCNDHHTQKDEETEVEEEKEQQINSQKAIWLRRRVRSRTMSIVNSTNIFRMT